MRRVAASLAAVLAALALTACDDDGAEPGAPAGATLVLDFQANAVHSGLYGAQARGYFEDEGLDLEIREPSDTATGAKLLAAGRTDFAILDINDFGIARQRGLDIVAIAAIVQRPLASVIAADRDEVRTPADLAGKTIGVTGVPSDDAVLDTILTQGGVDPGAIDRQTIGFEAVPLLAAGRVDAATAFWNAEGVDLKTTGTPTREFRVDEFGAPRYPELIVAAPSNSISGKSAPSCAFVSALERAYRELTTDPAGALDALLAATPGLDRASQEAQLDALLQADAFSSEPPEQGATAFLLPTTLDWVEWARENGVIQTDREVSSGFKLGAASVCSREPSSN